MSLNLFILQLGFVFLPGLLWARMHRAYVSKNQVTTVDFFINAFINGAIIYLIVFSVYKLSGRQFELLSVSDADKKLVITDSVAIEVAWALGLAPLLGLADMYISNSRVLVTLFQKVKATKRFGYEDIWDYTFNTDSPQVEYVHVRDFPKQVVFGGWVRAFSESEKARELLLRDVRVVDFDGVFLYEVPLLYLAGAADTFHIEFPVSSGDPA